MSIVHFPDSREKIIRRNHETSQKTIQSELSELLTQTPDNINNIIDKEYISPNELILVNTKELKALILDYIIFHLHKTKIAIEWSLIFSIQYISDLLFKIFLFKEEEVQIIVNHPYYTYWMEQWYPKRAWDVSVYSYMFRWFDKKSISNNDYIPLATSAYLEYSKDTKFAQWIWYMLPEIGNMLRDKNFLKRLNVREIKK